MENQRPVKEEKLTARKVKKGEDWARTRGFYTEPAWKLSRALGSWPRSFVVWERPIRHLFGGCDVDKLLPPRNNFQIQIAT